jgi:Skp family chaperone for outer membrane proteins
MRMVMVLAVLLLIPVVSGAAPAKVAYVDMAKVVKEYDKTKDAQDSLEKEFAAIKSDLMKMNSELEKQQQTLEAKKGQMSEKQLAKSKAKFDEDQETFHAKYQEVQENLKKRQNEVTDSLVEDIRKVVGQIARQEQYDAVFEKQVLLYGGEDITYKVLDTLNRKK